MFARDADEVGTEASGNRAGTSRAAADGTVVRTIGGCCCDPLEVVLVDMMFAFDRQIGF